MRRKADIGRINQRHRTRKDLLAAAGRLLKQGSSPDMDMIAREAMVSRATVYRYFPTIDALLVEAPLDGEVPEPQDIFADDASTDPVERVDKAEAALHEVCYRNESQLRRMLASTLQEGGRKHLKERGGIPIRQNRRMVLIEAALAPVRRRIDRAGYEKLCAALSMVFGTESMIVFSDVLGMDARSARRIKSWAARKLVEAAMKESKSTLAAHRFT